MTEKKKPFIREHGLTYNDYAALDDGNRYGKPRTTRIAR